MQGTDLVRNVTEFTRIMSIEWNSMTPDQKRMFKHDQEIGKAILAKIAQLEAMNNSTQSAPQAQQQQQQSVTTTQFTAADEQRQAPQQVSQEQIKSLDETQLRSTDETQTQQLKTEMSAQ